MNWTLAAIIAATLLSGAASVLAAAWLSLSLLAGVVRRLVSLSAGLLLGASILHLVPEAFESGADIHSLSWALLAGIIGFFALEKFAVLRHSHHHEHDGHGHHHGHDRDEAGPAGLVVLVGDTIHNTADGVVIAAAFLADPALGWITTAAIAAHEIPQEIGDFIVLINAGYTRRRALVYNLLSGTAAVVGGVVGYFALAHGQELLPYVLVVAAASFVYVALADLIPGLHRETRRDGEWFWQFALMLAGVAIITLSTTLLGAH
ncbi:MAG: ZIP family metal transporter [Burkholderiales bacterium]|nr:MAG: ZIP family metal transporter [Burkholderiales bacterium]